MYKHKKRTGYSFTIHDGEAVITLLRPLSGEYLQNGSYLVLYEDAFGTVEIETLTKEDIASKYVIDRSDLEEI
jgi:hypothetical protein